MVLARAMLSLGSRERIVEPVGSFAERVLWFERRVDQEES